MIKSACHNILQTTENDPDVVYVKHISQNFQHYILDRTFKIKTVLCKGGQIRHFKTVNANDLDQIKLLKNG